MFKKADDEYIILNIRENMSALLKIAVFLLLLAMTLVGFGSYSTYHDAVGFRDYLSSKAACDEATHMSKLLERQVFSAMDNLDFAAGESVFAEALAEAPGTGLAPENAPVNDALRRAQARLKVVGGKLTPFERAALVRVDGKAVVASDDDLLKERFGSEAFFRDALEQRLRVVALSPGMADPYEHPYPPSVWLGAPIRENDTRYGKIVGVLCASFRLPVPLLPWRTTRHQDESIVYVRDLQGRVVAHPDRNRLDTRDFPVRTPEREAQIERDPEDGGVWRAVASADGTELAVVVEVAKGASDWAFRDLWPEFGQKTILALGLCVAALVLVGCAGFIAGRERRVLEARAEEAAANAGEAGEEEHSRKKSATFGGGLLAVVFWLLALDVIFMITFWDKTVLVGRQGWSLPVSVWFVYLLPSLLAFALLAFRRTPITKEFVILALFYNGMIAVCYCGGSHYIDSSSYRLAMALNGNMEGLVIQILLCLITLAFAVYMRLSRRVQALYQRWDTDWPLWQ